MRSAGVLIVALSGMAAFALPRGAGAGDPFHLRSGSLELFARDDGVPPLRARPPAREVQATETRTRPVPPPPARDDVAPERNLAAHHDLEELLDTIRLVETGGEEDGGRHATGDGGHSIGPYQIQRAHWIDSRLPGRFEDCRDPEYARREVVAYWRRWCPAALERCDAEILARVHNGGPDGARKARTLRYWSKVRRVLESSPAAD